jgi:ParB family chromosome partitioning protein
MLAKLFPNNTKKIVDIDIDSIAPNPSQPRKYFEKEYIDELADSILQYGLLQPITVRRMEKGYELISGERRLRACKKAGLKKISSIIIDTDEQTSAVLALIENLQRRNLNFFEEAEAIERLISIHNLTQEELAIRLSRSQPSIANKMRILRILPNQQQKILDNNLTERHARALLKIDNDELRDKAIDYIVAHNLNVQDSENYIGRLILKDKTQKGKQMLFVKDIRLFTNTINHAITIMRKSGIEAVSQKEETDAYIEYRIKIPKENTKEKTSA